MNSAQSKDLQTVSGFRKPKIKSNTMQKNTIQDNNSEEYQRLEWESFKKSINGLLNRLTISNVSEIADQLFNLNYSIIRGRGQLCRKIISCQQSMPTFTHIYAALVAVINSKVAMIGKLLLKRLVVRFRLSFRQNDKGNCINNLKFIAHLINQNVADETLALEIFELLLENVTKNDSIEIFTIFMKEIGSKLESHVESIFRKFHPVICSSKLDGRVNEKVLESYRIRFDKFKDFPSVLPELDLIEEHKQITHKISLQSEFDTEDRLNVFRYDQYYQKNETIYLIIKKYIL